MSTQNSNNDNNAGSCKQKTLFGALSISAQETQIQVNQECSKEVKEYRLKKEKGPKVVKSCLTKIMIDSDSSQKILVLKES